MLNLRGGMIRDGVDVDASTKDEGTIVSEGPEAKSFPVLVEGVFVLVVS